MAKTKYTDAALLVGSNSAGRLYCQICFTLWGVGGLIYCFPPGLPGVTAGPSVNGLLYWIGGMMLFGLGGLLGRSHFDFKRPIEPTP
jgi:hypothetical protein